MNPLGMKVFVDSLADVSLELETSAESAILGLNFSARARRAESLCGEFFDRLYGRDTEVAEIAQRKTKPRH